MSDNEDTLETVEVRYTEADRYTTIPASRARGGVQLNGEFLIDFVLDRTVTSGSESREIVDTGIGDVIEDNSKIRLEREKQVGVIMGQNQAYGAATWIISNIIGEGTTAEDVQELIESEYPETFE